MKKRYLDPTLRGKETERLEADLRKRIVGQDPAIQCVLELYQNFLAGMHSHDSPVGNFLFLGPTGTGKTLMAEALAESLVGNACSVVKIDCAEFQHSHEIAKIVGSPPGYIGHRETHPLLSQEALDQYQTDNCKLSFVLFDEIEKSSDALWNLLLGILDKATLTLGDNRKVDFSQAMIFMTSNLGGKEMDTILQPRLGFAAAADARQIGTGIVDGKLASKLSAAGMEAARRNFTPEFLNRIDKVVVFQPLGGEQLKKILEIELEEVNRRALGSTQAQFGFWLTDEAKLFLLREGTNPKYGARFLKRAVNQYLVNPLSCLIASQEIQGGEMLEVDYDSVKADKLTFEVSGGMAADQTTTEPKPKSKSATAANSRR